MCIACLWLSNKSAPPTHPAEHPVACLPLLILCRPKFISTHAGPQQKQPPFWDFTLFHGPLPMKAKGPFPNLWRFKCSFDTTILPLVFVSALLTILLWNWFSVSSSRVCKRYYPPVKCLHWKAFWSRLVTHSGWRVNTFRRLVVHLHKVPDTNQTTKKELKSEVVNKTKSER